MSKASNLVKRTQRGPIGFVAHKSATQGSIESTVQTKIIFDVLEKDVGGGYSTANSRYIVVESGFYTISASVCWGELTTGGYADVRIMKNGTTIDYRLFIQQMQAADVDSCNISISGVSWLEENDWLEVHAVNNGTGSHTITSSPYVTYFSAIKN